MSSATDRLRRRAKALRKTFQAGETEARRRVAAILPGREAIRHSDALLVIAREEGFESWPRLKLAHEVAAMDRAKRAQRLRLALDHGQGWAAEALLADDPTLADANLGLQVALYREDAVRQALDRDPDAIGREVAGRRRPIVHLAFSQHWRRHPVGSAASVRMAELLVARGADVNDGVPAEPGSPHLLSALYGALGHAGNLALAEWLLEHGADPNDNESLYHACELGHADGLRLLLKHGGRSEGTNALPRAMDFDDLEMVDLLLAAGADPNEGIAAHPSTEMEGVLIPGLHQAARRMCSAAVAEALIRAGGDGTARYKGHTAYAIARMRGNRAVAEVLEKAGQAVPLDPTESLLALAAEGPVDGRIDPGGLSPEARRLVHRLLGFEDTLDHVKRLIGLGYDPDWTDEQGMPAVHIAAWEGLADAVAYLLSFGPDLAVKNMYGGDLMGTVIHGAEFCPARERRDHLACARLILEAGARVHRSDVEGCGVEDMAEMLVDWAGAHPDRVVEEG